jgi:hypothetical protein
MYPLLCSHRGLAIACALCLALTLVAYADDDNDIVAPPLVTADFSWAMAERTRSVINTDFKPEVNVEHRMIEGPIAGQPGLYDGVSSVPIDQINPADGYELILDACASLGATQYTWNIDGSEVATTDACTFSTRLPEGSHEVTLVVAGGGVSDSLSEVVLVEDILLVIMGDSYSSGEGNATIYEADEVDSSLDEVIANNGAGWSEGGYWDHANCHRSTRSGSASAAIDLEKADSHTSVTTIYLACSGAQIDSGILGIKDGYLGGAEEPQAKLAYDLTLAKGRAIDAIVMGIGGNDIGFVPIVAECALQEDCFFSTQAFLQTSAPDLPVMEKNTAIDPAALADLTLKQDVMFPDLLPGPPYLTLERHSLHACNSVFKSALLADGGVGPDETCRESIGTSPVGLAQVAQCLNGSAMDDCLSAPSYYDFETKQYKYPGGETWQGLGVPAERIFYTEYPDLTTIFAGDDPQGELEYCEIALTKNQLIILLTVAQKFVDKPVAIDVIIAVLEQLDLNSIGLTQNEFEYAAEAVLGGIEEPTARVLALDLTSDWNLKAPNGGVSTIGPAQPVDFSNIGTSSPALNEVTRLSQSVYGWHPTIGTFDLASGHGLCAPQGVDFDSTAAYAYLAGPLEGTNVSGSAHPNLLGQEAYRLPIAEALKVAFGL